MTHPDLPGLPERYHLAETLGTGGFGRVIRARDVVLDRDVAVKVMREPARDAHARRRFRREAQVTARVRHPHVVAVFDNGLLSDGSPYMVYEFVPGSSLEAATPEEVGPLALVAAALAEALAAIHATGAIHRDVKPANVLLRRPGDPVLLDLGIVRVEQEGTPFTPEGILLGTPGYMAPELFAGGLASPASDQFAWAATILRSAGGEAYRGNELREVISELRDFDPASRIPAGLPRGLRSVLVRALAKDPAKRYRSMDRVAEKLRAAVARRRSVTDERAIAKEGLGTSGLGRRHSRPVAGLQVQSTVRAPVTTRRVRGRDRRRVPLLLATGLVAVGIGYLLHRPADRLSLPVPSPSPGPRVAARPLSERLAGVLSGDQLENYGPPRDQALLERIYSHAMDPALPGRISRALREVENWIAALPPRERRDPDAVVDLVDALWIVDRELHPVVFVEERLRRKSPTTIFSKDPEFLRHWDREAIRQRHLVLRAMVDASLCRMENTEPDPGDLYPGLVLVLAKKFELLHGGGKASACEAGGQRGPRAFRRLMRGAPQVSVEKLPAYLGLIRDLTRLDTDFGALSSAERAEALDLCEDLIMARLSGEQRSIQLVDSLRRRGGLIRDSPQEDQEERLAEAKAALARVAAWAPERLGELPGVVADEDYEIFSGPGAFGRFLDEVQRLARP